MPRFLNTYTGEFVWIADVGATPYAIISHTWRSAEEGREQTYDDIVKLQTKCLIAIHHPWNAETAPPVNEAFFSHPSLSDKIKRACEVARNTGFRLLWIDSCCIDKRSSAELSEAINSMYALYRDADVCYAYLADVPDGTDPQAKDSDFKKSRWHKRGWTLQELTAPAHVVFLTRDWTFLGTKTGLASTLEKVTGVDLAILLGMKPVESASVAKRMSWAAMRETTRVEDRAYSLLGIFGVHLSPIYGEGTNAFLRLQEEIIKHIPDQSIFAWGPSRAPLEEGGGTLRGRWIQTDFGLLASSPDEFWDVGDVAPITASEFAVHMRRPRGRPLPPLHCVFTPQGAQIALMTISLPHTAAQSLVDKNAVHCPDCRNAMACSSFRRLALLRCTNRDGHLLALPLSCPEEDVCEAENVAIGVHPCCGDQWHASPRVVRLSASVLKDLGVVPMHIQVFLRRHWQKPFVPKARRDGFSKIELESPLSLWHFGGPAPEIRRAPNCEKELGTLGFKLTHIKSYQPENEWDCKIILATANLSRNSAAEQPPHDDQHMHEPPILIDLRLCPRSNDAISSHFSVDCPCRSATIESARPASETPDGFSYGHPLRDVLCHAPATDDDPHGQSCSFDVDLWCTARTITEAVFVIPDCTLSHTDDDAVSVNHVRLLRLKLERPQESAYVEDCDHLLLSAELSERFTSTSLTSSDGSVGRMPLAQTSTTETSITQDGLSPGLGGTPSPRHNAMHDSPELALSPTATSEQTAIRKGSGGPGPCEAIVHNGPNVTHSDGLDSGVPTSLHDTALKQDTLKPAISLTASSRKMAARDKSLDHDAGSAGLSALAGRPSECSLADVARIVAACPQDVYDGPFTSTDEHRNVHWHF